MCTEQKQSDNLRFFRSPVPIPHQSSDLNWLAVVQAASHVPEIYDPPISENTY